MRTRARRGACDRPPRSQDPVMGPGDPQSSSRGGRSPGATRGETTFRGRPYRLGRGTDCNASSREVPATGHRGLKIRCGPRGSPHQLPRRHIASNNPRRVTPSRQVLLARVADGLQCAIARGATDRPPRVRAPVLRPGAPKLALTRCPAVPDVGCGRGEVPASRRTDSQEAQVGRASRSSERGLVGRDCRAMLGAIGAAGCGHLGVSPVVRDLPRGPRRVAPSPAVPLGQPCGANPIPCTDSLDLPSRRAHAGPPASRHRSGVLHACGQRSILWIRLCQLGRPSQPWSWA